VPAVAENRGLRDTILGGDGRSNVRQEGPLADSRILGIRAKVRKSWEHKGLNPGVTHSGLLDLYNKSDLRSWGEKTAHKLLRRMEQATNPRAPAWYAVEHPHGGKSQLAGYQEIERWQLP
jgi:hypothetical protein